MGGDTIGFHIPSAMVAETMMAAIMGLHDEQAARLMTHPSYGKIAAINAKHKKVLIEKLTELEANPALSGYTEDEKKQQVQNYILSLPTEEIVDFLKDDKKTEINTSNDNKEIEIDTNNFDEFIKLEPENVEKLASTAIKHSLMMKCRAAIEQDKKNYIEKLQKHREEVKLQLEKNALVNAYLLSVPDETEKEFENLHEKASAYQNKLLAASGSPPGEQEKKDTSDEKKAEEFKRHYATYLTQVFIDYYHKTSEYDQTFKLYDNLLNEGNKQQALTVSLRATREENLQKEYNENNAAAGVNGQRAYNNNNATQTRYDENNKLAVTLKLETSEAPGDAKGDSKGGSTSTSPKLTETEQLHEKAQELDRENKEYFNHLDLVKKRKNAELARELNRIGMETFQKVQENIATDKIIWWGRYSQSHPFAAFCGTTFAGSFILIGLDYAVTEKTITNEYGEEEIIRNIDYDLLTGFALGSVPIFLVVWMANYYITKNLSGQLLYEFFIKGQWVPTSTQEWLSFICSLAATWVSCIFTYFTTYTFLEELTLALNDFNDLGEEVTGLFMGFGAASAIFTFITYFAVMHLYGKKFSWNINVEKNLKEIGDLAVISDLPWAKVFLGRGIVKMGLSVALIFLMNNPLGWILLGLSSTYLLLSLLNWILFKSNHRRTAAQLQVILLAIYSIISMAFLMYAAADILEMIYGDSLAAQIGSYLTMFLSWLGVACFYVISTMESVLHALKSNTEKSLGKEDGQIELKELTEANAKMYNATNSVDKSTGAKEKELSLAERLVLLMIGGNGVSNGLGNFYGAIEFAEEYGFEAAETYALAVTAFFYSSAVSAASNYKGIQADDSRASEIARLNGRLRLVQNAQQYLASNAQTKEQFISAIEVALEEITKYRSATDSVKRENDKSHLSYFQKERYMGINRTAQTSALNKIEKLLINFKKLPYAENKNDIKSEIDDFSKNSDKKLTQDEKIALNQGYLGAIYNVYLRPFEEMACAEQKLEEYSSDLTNLIAAVNKYNTDREGNAEYTFGSDTLDKYVGSQWKLVPGYSKTDKKVATKLLQHLNRALVFFTKTQQDTNSTNKSDSIIPEPFTKEEIDILADGRLGILYNQALKYLPFAMLNSNRNPTQQLTLK